MNKPSLTPGQQPPSERYFIGEYYAHYGSRQIRALSGASADRDWTFALLEELLPDHPTAYVMSTRACPRTHVEQLAAAPGAGSARSMTFAEARALFDPTCTEVHERDNESSENRELMYSA